jgi:hypothetical protein
MEPVVAVFAPDLTVGRAVEMIREWTHDTLITYGYIVDEQRKLLGVVAMRDLLLAKPEDQLKDVMLLEPFSLRPEEDVGEAMKEVVYRHYPLYPVCDMERHLLGIVQGFMLFEHQQFEISAQYGSMVGVHKEEHASTGWVAALLMPPRCNSTCSPFLAASSSACSETPSRSWWCWPRSCRCAGHPATLDAGPGGDHPRHHAERIQAWARAARGHQGNPPGPRQRVPGRLAARHRCPTPRVPKRSSPWCWAWWCFLP